MRLAIQVQIDPQMVRLVRKMGRLVSEEAGLDEMDAIPTSRSMPDSFQRLAPTT